MFLMTFLREDLLFARCFFTMKHFTQDFDPFVKFLRPFFL